MGVKFDRHFGGNFQDGPKIMHSRKPTWNLKIIQLKRNIMFQAFNFGFGGVVHQVWVGVKNVTTLDFCIINLPENLMEPFQKPIE